MPGWLNFLIVLTLVVVLLSWQSVGDVILIGSTSCLFVGTVLRMWDSVAEADRAGEFGSQFSRTPHDEIRRLFAFFTPLERFEQASTTDRELYYLRTAQSWFFLSIGAFGALLLAVSHVIF